MPPIEGTAWGPNRRSVRELSNRVAVPAIVDRAPRHRPPEPDVRRDHAPKRGSTMSIVPYQPYPDQPRDPLALAVIPWVQAGWAVESRAAAQVILVSKAPCNHVLHGLLLAANFFIGGTLAACLFWTLIVPVVWFAALIGQ